MNGGTSALKQRGCCCSDREVAIPAISSGSSGKADMKGGGAEQLKGGTPPQNIRSHGVGLTDETGVPGRSQLEQRRDRCTTLVAATRQNPRTESEAKLNMDKRKNGMV